MEMTTPTTFTPYETDLRQILQEHFEADDIPNIPCQDFTVIREAYENHTCLTVAAVQASILEIIDEPEDEPFPSSMYEAIVVKLG